MSQPFVQRASWIWSAEGTHAAPPPEAATPSHYQVRLFRRTFELADPAAARLEVHVSADSRYLFFCNGTLIGRGPAKGDVNHHFYDTYDLTPRLRAGENALAALVLDMSRVAHRPALLGAPCSVMTYAGGFVLEGAVGEAAGEAREDVSTDERWKVAVDMAHRFQSENTTFEGYQGYFEHRASKFIPADWNAVEFDDTSWPRATVLYKAERRENRRDPTSPYGLVPRMIPMMEEMEPRNFAEAFVPGGGDPPPGWADLVTSDADQGARASRPLSSECGPEARAPKIGTTVVVPPHTTVEVILDAGELTTAYPRIDVAGGADSVVRLTYAEALRLPWGTPGATLLGRPQSLSNLASHFADESTGWTFDRRGKITGWCDIWEPAASEGGAEPLVGPEPWPPLAPTEAGKLAHGEIAGRAWTPFRASAATSAAASAATSAAASAATSAAASAATSAAASAVSGVTALPDKAATKVGPYGATQSSFPTETFEPLHWRAFRYVGLRITTADQPMELRAVRHRFTAYPYRVAAEFWCSDPRLEKIWRAALHTMRLCSHETFEDCPHYEQMQYAGDTMITSKIAMLTSGDYRLSRQALLHFDWSRLSDGLTQSRYPSRLVQIIPSWSLHWITNVRDYAFCSGDLATVCEVMPGMRAVLDWFRRHADANGLPARLPFWNITDWCPWWPRGVVPGTDTGPTCIISAQYIVALVEVADLCRLLGCEKEMAELRAEATALRLKLHARFWSESEGVYFDRPGGPEISQYGNAWAIVCGAPAPRELARIMQRFPSDPKLAPGSFFWWHAGFRALDLAGAYDRMPEFLGPWHEMIDHGLSTFVEENSYWRSLCHAWSAHPALEFLTRVLGVTPRAPGFAEITVAPHCCGLSHARGSVCTPRGNVAVAWRSAGGKFALEIGAPPATPVHVRLPNGEQREFAGGKFSVEVLLPA